MNLIIKNREIEAVKFMNKNWWYSPSDLQKLAQLTVEKYSLQFLIINQFASNPERDRVVYKLFSTESTVSFDEVWQLLDGFSVNFFLEKYRKAITEDKRYQIKRYYRLFVARLLMKKGEYKEALSQLSSAYNEMQIDPEYEKLFKARCLESMIICKFQENKNENVEALSTELFSLYPQLIPYSGIAPAMRLHIIATNPIQTKIKENLEDLNVTWSKNQSAKIPDVYIDFKQNNGHNVAKVEVKLNGTGLIAPTEISYKTEKDAFPLITQAMFGIGNDDKATEKK